MAPAAAARVAAAMEAVVTEAAARVEVMAGWVEAAAAAEV